MDHSNTVTWPKWLPSFGGHQGKKREHKPRVLIVDDEPNVRLMYRSSLSGLGYDLYEASTAESALEQLQEREHDAAILDLKLPGMSGLELLEQMIGLGINVPVAFVTAHGQAPDAIHAMELGAIDFLPKPPTPEQLRDMVSDILLRHAPPADIAGDEDFEFYLRSAKRAINLRDFDAATEYLVKALDINPGSRPAINMVGVMIEMRQEHERTSRR